MAELHNRIPGAVLHTPEVVPHTLEAALRTRAVAPGEPLPEVAAKMLPGAVVAEEVAVAAQLPVPVPVQPQLHRLSAIPPFP